jgi:U3 small nucleolar RNA-associated protein 24
MGKAKKTRKFATVKRMIGSRDSRLKANADKAAEENKKKDADELVREM